MLLLSFSTDFCSIVYYFFKYLIFLHILNLR
uniref:Actin cytoskeleton-regulatory complex protein n=1 Tax=Siphoviridae sp. ct3gT1 TaxID=2825323 RepID=A0A8S5UJL9_9CAUD|nr:MAG TPA: actin cytoskeleton-regulatory complex protein [Siphoviridae sp. ct3gT1]